MTEIEACIWRAWGQVYPRLEADAGLLAERMARRDAKEMSRPPRGWCVALRADDSRLGRIGRAHGARGWGEAVALPGSVRGNVKAMVLARREGVVPVRTEVELNAGMIREACAGVQLGGGGSVIDVAAKLGVTAHAVYRAAGRNGRLEVKDARGELGVGPWDKERMRKCEELGISPDSDMAKRMVRGHRRVEVRLGKGDDGWFDPGSQRIGARPDPAWSGVWRDHGDRVPDTFSQVVERVRVFQKGKHGEEIGGGMRWVCPACEFRTRVLYLPLRVWGIAEFLGVGRSGWEREGRPPGLACWQCHGVRWFKAGQGAWGWSHFVGHITGGLLYGSEVEKPDWVRALEGQVVDGVKCEVVKRRRRQESPRRMMAVRLREQGMAFEEIGRRMGLSAATVRVMLSQAGRGVQRVAAPVRNWY